MNSFWKTLICFVFVTVVAVGADVQTQTQRPWKQVTPIVVGKPDADVEPDYSKLNITQLLAQAKEVARKTRDDLEAARGVMTMKKVADEQKATLDQTCSRIMGETLKKLTETATKTQKESQAMAKEIERRLALEKSAKKP